MVILILIMVILSMVSIMDIMTYGFKLQKIYVHVIDMGVVALILWILVQTRYAVGEKFVYYQNGPLKGRILIQKIQSIQPVTNKWNVLQPGIHNKGLRIKMESGLTFFFAPRDNNTFTKAIKEKNPKIKVG